MEAANFKCYSKNYTDGLTAVIYLVCFFLPLVIIIFPSMSQDTVIAMKALAGFAEDTYTRTLNKQISFEIPSLSSVEPLTINGGNRYERNVVNVSFVSVTGSVTLTTVCMMLISFACFVYIQDITKCYS